MVEHGYNSSLQEAKAGGSRSSPDYILNTLTQKEKKETINTFA